MASFPVMKTLIREVPINERSKRIPEPGLMMVDPDKVEAYREAR